MDLTQILVAVILLYIVIRYVLPYLLSIIGWTLIFITAVIRYVYLYLKDKVNKVRNNI